MSRDWSTFRCKLGNFEAIIEKWRKLGYKVYPRYLRDDNTLIVGKYKIKENQNGRRRIRKTSKKELEKNE